MRRLLIVLLFAWSLRAGTVNVTDAQFGAVGDMRTCADMAITSGSTTLSSPSPCNFSAGDVNKWVQVPLAGDSFGSGLSAQITRFTDTHHVTLSVSAGASSSGVTGTIGTGNYAALTSVASYACSHSGTKVNFPAGNYYIEKYKIQGGGSANGVTDIAWTNCTNTIVTGYGALVSSNGSYHQLQDRSTFLSWEQTVSAFSITNANTFTIQGLEISGNVEKTTMAANVAEGQSYGIVTAGCSNLSIIDVNSHSFPADSISLGLNSVDTNDVITNVVTSHSARQGLTVGNVAGLVATNYQCSLIGYTGAYGNHPPSNCVDIEPAILPKASGIVFNNSTLTNALGALFTVTAENGTDVTISGGTFTCLLAGACANGGLGQINASTTIIQGITFYGSTNAGFHCGGNSSDTNWLRSDIRNNTIIFQGLAEMFCEDLRDTLGIPVHFTNNTVTVTGAAVDNGSMQFRYAKEVRGNTFFVSKNAKFAHTINIMDYTGVAAVENNTYSTDLTNASDPYATLYTSAGLVCNEVSQEPTYFVVGSGGNAACQSMTAEYHYNRYGRGSRILGLEQYRLILISSHTPAVCNMGTIRRRSKPIDDDTQAHVL
jgi:hypothetical protein